MGVGGGCVVASVVRLELWVEVEGEGGIETFTFATRGCNAFPCRAVAICTVAAHPATSVV